MGVTVGEGVAVAVAVGVIVGSAVGDAVGGWVGDGVREGLDVDVAVAAVMVGVLAGGVLAASQPYSRMHRMDSIRMRRIRAFRTRVPTIVPSFPFGEKEQGVAVWS